MVNIFNPFLSFLNIVTLFLIHRTNIDTANLSSEMLHYEYISFAGYAINDAKRKFYEQGATVECHTMTYFRLLKEELSSLEYSQLPSQFQIKNKGIV